MSNLNAIALIVAILLVGYPVLVYAANSINRRGDMIVAGVAEGVPVSITHRWLMLYHIFLMQLGAVIGVSAVVAIACVQVAHHVAEPDVKTLAYLVAALAAFSGANWLFLGPSYFIHCFKVLRQAEAD